MILRFLRKVSYNEMTAGTCRKVTLNLRCMLIHRPRPLHLIMTLGVSHDWQITSTSIEMLRSSQLSKCMIDRPSLPLRKFSGAGVRVLRTPFGGFPTIFYRSACLFKGKSHNSHKRGSISTGQVTLRTQRELLRAIFAQRCYHDESRPRKN